MTRWRALRVVTAVVRFVRERYPPLVSVPMAIALAGGTADAFELPRFLRLAAATWLGLLAGRSFDDIADIEIDRLRKPGRGLPSGRIDRRDLIVGSGLALACAVLLLSKPPFLAVICVAATTLILAFQYAYRDAIAPLLHTAVLNAPFFTVPLLWPLDVAHASPKQVALAGFVWLSVVGHDFAHSIESKESRGSGGLEPLLHARLGALFFLLAAILGIAIGLCGRERAFGAALGVTGIWILAILARLLRDPTPENAARIYVPGGLFYLVPLLARLASQWPYGS